MAPPSLVWKAPSHKGRRCRAGSWHRPMARAREVGGRGGGEPSGASFRADLGRREQRPMHPSPASPPSCHLGLESHRTAPAWTSQSVGQAEAREAKPPMSALSRPELGYKWCSQGDCIHTADIGGGAPVGAALSPTPVQRLLCRWDPQRQQRAHLGPTVRGHAVQGQKPHWLGPCGPGGTLRSRQAVCQTTWQLAQFRNLSLHTGRPPCPPCEDGGASKGIPGASAYSPVCSEHPNHLTRGPWPQLRQRARP